MNNQYLIPANSKKSQLIFSIFTSFDLIMFAIGVSVSFLLMLMIKTDNVVVMGFLIAPALITGVLVLPIPYYHNVMGFFGSMLNYLSSRKQYYWRGWCVKDAYGRDYESRNKF